MGQAGGPGVGGEKKWGWEVMWGGCRAAEATCSKAEERMWGCSRAGEGDAWGRVGAAGQGRGAGGTH